MKGTKEKQYLYFVLFILVFAVSGCKPSSNLESYGEKYLRIAVIGEPPEATGKQVRFTEISLDKMTTEDLKLFDAVFITKENLSEAAESQYTDIYLNSTTPFFFISTISHIPFTMKNTKYDKIWNWTPGNSYAVGILTSQEDYTLNSWGYGLQNDKKTDKHIDDMYARIFETIDELKH
ncbi:hypothetical protein [Lederbergia lenta]|uniref:Lipoprotein n=1 Tax=Lederbergia lenta TaxID=1467 RepID=A0A2X4ZDX6_LEDLE|nr:hypothetical protein [Lederbergia lenta]MEC2324674.1 hypothetical protein [Lederbergia lenta]SQI58674.1 lipoprotein [Lederbergia lenta]